MVFLETPLRLSLFLPAGRRRPAIVRRRHDRSRGIVNPLSLMSLWIKGKADSPRSAGLAAGHRRPGLSQQPAAAGTSSCRRRWLPPRPAAPPAGRDPAPFLLPLHPSRPVSYRPWQLTAIMELPFPAPRLLLRRKQGRSFRRCHLSRLLSFFSRASE